MLNYSLPVDEEGKVTLEGSTLTLEDFVDLLLKEELTPDEDKLLKSALRKKNLLRFVR